MQSWLEQISHQCALHRTRQLVVISGDLGHRWQQLQPWVTLELAKAKNIALIGTQETALAMDCPSELSLLKANKPNNLLGYEHDHVIFNAYDGLYPDAIAAVSGTIKAGGLLILLCPEFDQWPMFGDEFSKKRLPYGFDRSPTSTNFVHFLINSFTKWQTPLYSNSPISGEPNCPAMKDSSADHNEATAKQGCLTTEQQVVLDRILNNQNQTHVLTADRGRGKSYLLGCLAAQLHKTHYLPTKDNGIKIYLTGPNKKAVSSVYTGFNSLSSGLEVEEQIHFVAPEDVLALNPLVHDWLIIDEAASLPIPLLMKYAHHFNHLVFASTTHGYEGTGKGFQVRFFEYLNKHKPDWQQHQLTHPIRYSDNDPLEHWLFETLMLDAEPETVSSEQWLNSKEDMTCREVTQKELTKDSALLKNIFGLLINAHYQTKPSDLRDMLDAPGLRIFIQSILDKQTDSEIIISACLCTDEGPIEQALWQPIYQGHRRPTGHLIPQSFGFYLGLPDAMSMKYARVIRIATQPVLQRNNSASDLLTFIENKLSNEGYDVLGSSFAGTSDVINFWQKNHFCLIKSGSIADHASGVTSALVVKSLSERSKNTIEKASSLFNYLTSGSEHTFEAIPEEAKFILHNFATEKGSAESTLQILATCEGFDAPKTPLNKNAVNKLRKDVKDWLATHR